MKVVCESCQTRYAIADEKVRGKTFKIKCKKCGAFMVIRPVGGEAAAADPKPGTDGDEEKETRVFNYAEFEKLMADKSDSGTPAAVVGGQARGDAADAAAEWYLLLGEEQVGPLTGLEVEDRIRRGDVSAETYAWREGLADWRPVREVDGLAMLLTGGSAQAPSSSTPNPSANGGSKPAVLGYEDEATRAEVASSGAFSGAAGSHEVASGQTLGFGSGGAALAGAGIGLAGSGGMGGSQGSADVGPSGGAGVGLGFASGLGASASTGSPQARAPSSASPFGNVSGNLAVDTSSRAAAFSQSTPMIDPSPKPMTGQRHEDSVLFSLKSLGVVSFNQGDDAASAKVVAQPSPSPRPLGGTQQMRAVRDDVPLPPPIMVPVAQGGMSSSVRLVLVLVVVALLGTGGVLAYVLTRDDPKPLPVAIRAPDEKGVTTLPPLPPAGGSSSAGVAATPPQAPGVAPGAAGATGTPAGSATTAGAAPGSGGALAVAPPAPVPPAVAEEEEEEVVEKGKRKRVKRRKPSATTVASARAAPSEAPASEPAVPDLPTPTAPRAAREEEPTEREEPPKTPARSADSDVQAILDGKVPNAPKVGPAAPPAEALPETLDKNQIKKVVRRNMSGVIRCYNTKVADKAAVKGTLNVTFTIFGTGRTGGIRVQKPDFWGSEFVGCAGNALSRWKFPRFKGDEIEITYPFVLGGF